MPETAETEESAPTILLAELARSDAEPAAEPQEALDSRFGLERRAGWNVSRRALRLINLERRARFARIETA